MDEIEQFVRERLREDGRDAQSVLWEGSGNSMDWELTASATVFTGEDEFYAVDRTVAHHIVRHNPARVLADIEAKRRILDWLRGRDDWALDNNLWTWSSDDALRLLALPYADHPAYREEWRP